jgi:cytochrome d ubiquinol oxidase subunit I
MQHPVGYVINPESGRAELTDFGAVLFQNTTVATFAHVIATAFLTSGVMLVAVSLIVMMMGKSVDAMRKSLTVGIITTLLAAVAVMYSGDVQAKIMVQQQPMKMAAAEALYDTTENAPFSILTVGDISGQNATPVIEIPGLLSFMATGYWTGPESTVQGINDLQAQYEEQFGPGEYAPYVPLIYWAFRGMIGLGVLGILFALFAWWKTRKNKPVPSARWIKGAAVAAILFPVLGASSGWIFTEMGRQPWIVYGLMFTSDGVSPTLTATQAWISIITFTLLYGVLAVIEIALLVRAVKIGPPETVELADHDDVNSGQPLTFSY